MTSLVSLNSCFRNENEVDEAFQHLARTTLLGFTVFTKEDYKISWHHKLLARKLDAFVRGEIRYLMVFMPPRHGKSELVSRRLPAFLHGLYPDAEIMAASYLDTLAGDMCIDVQNIIDSKEYRELFPNTRIYPPGTSYTKGTRNSSEHHICGRRGKYRGQGVGGSFTGKGANFVIIDDPIKGREIADSVAFRERLWDFYNNDLFSRLETNLSTGRRGQVLITQTRWHEDDLSGRLLELMRQQPGAVQWEILHYPAIRVDEDTESDPREVGQALWPEKFNLEQLNEIKASVGPRAWSSLYQQNPVPDGGTLFTESMFEYAKLPDKFNFTFITGDTAYKDKQENDYTVMAAWGWNGSLWLIDVYRKRIKAAEAELPIINFIANNSTYGFRGAYIEPKGHGIYLNQILPKRGVIMPSEEKITEFYKDRKYDKTERASNAVPNLTNKKVYINALIHLKEELVSEALAFPKGKHDDFVDCLVDAIKIAYPAKVQGILGAMLQGR